MRKRDPGASGLAASAPSLPRSSPTTKSRAIRASPSARNPSAAGEIRGVLILGLVLIESLSIYVLLISLILFFLKPFSA